MILTFGNRVQVDVVTGSSYFNPQSQSESELRKRVADIEEENRSIKQRLERIEMQQQQPFMYVPRMQKFQQPNLIQKDVQQQGLQASGQVVGSLLPPQNVIHQSQRTLPQMPSSKLYFFASLSIYVGTCVLLDISLTFDNIAFITHSTAGFKRKCEWR